MRVNNTGSDFPIPAPDTPNTTRAGQTANVAGPDSDTSDDVVLSRAASAAASAVNAIGDPLSYEPDSVAIASRIIDSAIVKID